MRRGPACSLRPTCSELRPRSCPPCVADPACARASLRRPNGKQGSADRRGRRSLELSPRGAIAPDRRDRRRSGSAGMKRERSSMQRPPSITGTARKPLPSGLVGQDEIERAVHGKPEVVRKLVICLLARGHLLLEDVPGVGKTTLAHALARTPRCGVPPHPVHERPAARATSRGSRFPSTPSRRESPAFPLPAGTDLRQRRAGRRGQPRQPQDPVRAARSDERAHGQRRRRESPAARSLLRDRHAESAGAPRHPPASRESARSLRDAALPRLSRSGNTRRVVLTEDPSLHALPHLEIVLTQAELRWAPERGRSRSRSKNP